uniref:Uncharacterized protein LOC104212887 n=1 Tax=Nicotiana sylvestris TaxID=4096 RepID=A0A1U7V6F3_NICSY|nr:PREDICTED: uncharacterized protein LOC104212887 [Nicotiana sylvestris]
MVEVESIHRVNIQAKLFLKILEKYHRYRDRCHEMHERLRTDPRNWALAEELEKRDQELMQTIHSKSSLEEQLQIKDEELELGKGAAAECEHLQGTLRSMQSEMDQNLVKVEAISMEWMRKLTVLESKVTGLESIESAWSEASARATALENTIHVLQSEQESERAIATLREARLEERIGVINQEASVLGDRVAALEEENEHDGNGEPLGDGDDGDGAGAGVGDGGDDAE